MLGESNDLVMAWCLPVAVHIMLTPATGGSCLKAIEVLLEQGVKEERILFLNLVSGGWLPEHRLI